MPEDISLLPTEVEKKREEEARVVLLRKASLVFLIVSFVFGASVFIYSLVLKSQLSKLEQNSRDESSKISSLTEVETKAQDLAARIGVLKTVFGEKIYFSNLLTTVSQAVPADVGISEMTVPSAEVISVSGTSRSYISLAKFLLNLKDAKIFAAVELHSVSLDRETGEAKFDVSLKLTPEVLKK